MALDAGRRNCRRFRPVLRLSFFPKWFVLEQCRSIWFLISNVHRDQVSIDRVRTL